MDNITINTYLNTPLLVNKGINIEIYGIIRPAHRFHLFDKSVTFSSSKPITATYIIFNTVTGHYYIGSTISIYNRLLNNRKTLRNNKHHAVKLQEIYNKQEELTFLIGLIYTESAEESREIEDKLIKEHLGKELCCNMIDNALAASNGMSNAAKENMRQAQLGKKLSSDTKKKLSIAHKGKIFSEEHRANIRKVKIGSKASSEAKRNMSESRKKVIMSDDWKQSISKSLKGRKFSPEHRMKLSLAGKGKKLSPEHIEKMRISKKGYKASPETRVKLKESLRLRLLDPEYRKKLSNSQKGRKMSPESIAKRIKATTGRKRTPEQRERIRKATQEAMDKLKVKRQTISTYL